MDPDPADLNAPTDQAGRDAAEKAANAVIAHCEGLIEAAGENCVAVKPQVACFERLGAAGWTALVSVISSAKAAGLLVVVDGKRGDVPVSASAYGQAMVGTTETPWGEVNGLDADAFTVNPMFGGDSLDVFTDAAAAADAGIFALVRTSNPGALEIQDSADGSEPLHERLAALVASRADSLRGPESGLTGMGAVIGATAPEHMAKLRESMPDSIFLLPGVGAQGGKPEDLTAALAEDRPASILVPASRSIASAPDPAAAAAELRETIWGLTA